MLDTFHCVQYIPVPAIVLEQKVVHKRQAIFIMASQIIQMLAVVTHTHLTDFLPNQNIGLFCLIKKVVSLGKYFCGIDTKEVQLNLNVIQTLDININPFID